MRREQEGCERVIRLDHVTRTAEDGTFLGFTYEVSAVDPEDESDEVLWIGFDVDDAREAYFAYGGR